jgi:hypothetical protein
MHGIDVKEKEDAFVAHVHAHLSFIVVAHMLLRYQFLTIETHFSFLFLHSHDLDIPTCMYACCHAAQMK